MSGDKSPCPRKRHRTSALALIAAGILSVSLVAESSAQRGFGGGGFAGGRGFGGPGTGGRFPGGGFPGGPGPRGPGGVVMLPSGGYGPSGPGTVVVVDDDDDAPPARRHKTKQVKQKQKQQQKQIVNRGGFDVPPANERRFVANEVLLNIPAEISTSAFDAVARRNRLTRLELRDFAMTRHRIARLRINDGRPVATVIRALQAEARILGAQPNYLYSLMQGAAAAADQAQYAIGKMHLSEAHAIATGASVRVAVVDSMIDATHPELAGAIAASFDATGTPDKPHFHGTGIAGVIAAHGKLTGAAPAVQILAVHAFASQGSNGSSMNILKGLDWTGTSNADIVNMSFAGPADAELHTMIAALRRKGLTLVAAAGNAGPNSRPLYPAADPEVIAVTATDSDDKIYPRANRGTHIAVAAPGVSILAAAPDGAYQLQSGTSFAAAQVSGIAALLLDRNRKLDPAAIRRILMSTAHDLGPPGHDDQFGSGLVDALEAVQSAAPKSSEVSGSATPQSN